MSQRQFERSTASATGVSEVVDPTLPPTLGQGRPQGTALEMEPIAEEASPEVPVCQSPPSAPVLNLFNARRADDVDVGRSGAGSTAGDSDGGVLVLQHPLRPATGCSRGDIGRNTDFSEPTSLEPFTLEVGGGDAVDHGEYVEVTNEHPSGTGLRSGERRDKNGRWSERWAEQTIPGKGVEGRRWGEESLDGGGTRRWRERWFRPESLEASSSSDPRAGEHIQRQVVELNAEGQEIQSWREERVADGSEVQSGVDQRDGRKWVKMIKVEGAVRKEEVEVTFSDGRRKRVLREEGKTTECLTDAEGNEEWSMTKENETDTWRVEASGIREGSRQGHSTNGQTWGVRWREHGDRREEDKWWVEADGYRHGEKEGKEEGVEWSEKWWQSADGTEGERDHWQLKDLVKSGWKAGRREGGRVGWEEEWTEDPGGKRLTKRWRDGSKSWGHTEEQQEGVERKWKWRESSTEREEEFFEIEKEGCKMGWKKGYGKHDARQWTESWEENPETEEEHLDKRWIEANGQQFGYQKGKKDGVEWERKFDDRSGEGHVFEKDAQGNEFHFQKGRSEEGWFENAWGQSEEGKQWAVKKGGDTAGGWEEGWEELPDGTKSAHKKGANHGGDSWEEQWHESFDQSLAKKTWAKKTGKNAMGDQWEEEWVEDAVVGRKQARKWGKSGGGAEWEEKWGELNGDDPLQRGEKWCSKWAKDEGGNTWGNSWGDAWEEGGGKGHKWGEEWFGKEGDDAKDIKKWAHDTEGRPEH